MVPFEEAQGKSLFLLILDQKGGRKLEVFVCIVVASVQRNLHSVSSPVHR